MAITQTKRSDLIGDTRPKQGERIGQNLPDGMVAGYLGDE